MGVMRNSFKIFVGKPEGKILLEKIKRSWEDNIRIDLGEIRWKVVDWMYLGQYRVQWRVFVNTIMNCRFHKRWGVS
jgi:hypothetical protein